MNLLPIRRGARVILVNDSEEVLLIQHSDNIPANPARPEQLVYWVAPGGGLEGEETFEEAAIRELQEETGVTIESLDSVLLERDIDLNIGSGLVTCREKYYLARINGRPTPFRYNVSPHENISDFRWWPIEEIGTSTETFFPEGLYNLVSSALSHNTNAH